MRPDYPKWLDEQKYSDNTQSAQLHRVKKVEEFYGSLDDHFKNGTYQELIDSIAYSRSDERANRPNPSKIKIEGSIWKGLSSYRNAIVRYQKFLNNSDFRNVYTQTPKTMEDSDVVVTPEESNQQRLSLERDMQVALRRNIVSLGASLRIIDEGAERAVDSGLIDITCEDDNAVVVIELKAGKADSRAVAQILGYMGDLSEEEEGREIRGILVAHDFDKRTKAAARVVPSLKLIKYSIEFKFVDEQ